MKLFDLLKETLTGVKYGGEAIKDRLNELGKVYPDLAGQVEDFNV